MSKFANTEELRRAAEIEFQNMEQQGFPFCDAWEVFVKDRNVRELVILALMIRLQDPENGLNRMLACLTKCLNEEMEGSV